MTGEQFIDIIIELESGGDLNAVGDNNRAFGCLQIRQDYLTDANKMLGTRYVLSQMMGNRDFSEKIVWAYMKRYARADRIGREPTALDLARIHNGGPNGYKKIAQTQVYADRFCRITWSRGLNPYEVVREVSS